METNKKQFDSVRMMRKIRDKLNQEFKDMSFEEEKKYIRERVNISISKKVERKRQSA